MNHQGGDKSFWRNERVRNYDRQQSLLSEKKEDMLENITRIVNYLVRQNSIKEPTMLDIGCGPGSPMTLSNWLLEKMTNSIVIGVDSSEQMVGAANEELSAKYPARFIAYEGDFNSDSFWNPAIDRKYDLIVSSAALHYLSDARRIPFFNEVFNHLKASGAFVCSLGNNSAVPIVAEMSSVFRAEFTYRRLSEDRRPGDFARFRESFDETDRKANINWQPMDEWIRCLKAAGFRQSDVVWHLWVKSIFVAFP